MWTHSSLFTTSITCSIVAAGMSGVPGSKKQTVCTSAWVAEAVGVGCGAHSLTDSGASAALSGCAAPLVPAPGKLVTADASLPVCCPGLSRAEPKSVPPFGSLAPSSAFAQARGNPNTRDQSPHGIKDFIENRSYG